MKNEPPESSLKILFDECLGKPMMERLSQLIAGDARFGHVVDYYAAGTADNVWLPALSKEGWIVISSDRGKSGAKGGKLPSLCREYKVTHVLLGAALHHMKSADKIASLMLVWEQIARLPSEPRGTRFMLRYRRTQGQNGLSLALVRETEEPAHAKSQRQLPFATNLPIPPHARGSISPAVPSRPSERPARQDRQDKS